MKEDKIDLGNPSVRLLEYYKKKASEWKLKFHELASDVEDCRVKCCSQVDTEYDLTRKNEEVNSLRLQISELKQSLNEERQHIGRIVRDKDRLRIELAESKRKMKILLDFAGLKECDLFPMDSPLKEVPNTFKIKSNVKKLKELGPDARLLAADEESSKETLKLEIKMLESHLEEQHETFQERVESLTQEVTYMRDHYEQERRSLQNRIKCLNCQLEKTKMKIVRSLYDRVNQQEEKIEEEIALMDENEKLLRCLNICQELLGEDFPSSVDPSFPRSLRRQIVKLTAELQERSDEVRALSSLLTSVKTQLVTSQGNEMKLTEKLTLERTKLLERIQALQLQLEREKKRRLLESEGFRNDIKLLRGKLTSIERSIRLEALKKKAESNDDETH